MKAVVDTNVIAYLLLGTERWVEEARRFMEALTEGMAPAVWEAELANVVWMAVRKGVLPAKEGPRRLSLAMRLGIQSVPCRVLWRGALVRAVRSGVAIYDTLFVELASRERVPLATFDGRLLKAFPEIAARPGSLVPPSP